MLSCGFVEAELILTLAYSRIVGGLEASDGIFKMAFLGCSSLMYSKSDTLNAPNDSESYEF